MDEQKPQKDAIIDYVNEIKKEVPFIFRKQLSSLEIEHFSSDSDTGCPLDKPEKNDNFWKEIQDLEVWDWLHDDQRTRNRLIACPHSHWPPRLTKSWRRRQQRPKNNYLSSSNPIMGLPIINLNDKKCKDIIQWTPESLSETNFYNSLQADRQKLKRRNMRLSNSESLNDRKHRKGDSYLSDDESNSSNAINIKDILSSQDSLAATDLQRENAHFWISEMVIGAIQEINYNKPTSIPVATRAIASNSDSDGEVADDFLTSEKKKAIELGRRKERKNKKRLRKMKNENRLIEDDGWLVVPKKINLPYLSNDLKEIENEKQRYKSGGTTGGTTSDTDDEQKKIYSTCSNSLPENVARSILDQYSDEMLSVILVNNYQYLSPKPTDGIRILGTKNWAPIRPQLVFNSFDLPADKNVQLTMQKNRCPSCGLNLIKSEFSDRSRLRFCYYFGKYFCRCCHDNQLNYIPAKILTKWDFKRYAVSKFADDLITNNFDNVDTWPFNIDFLNMNLYKYVKEFEKVHEFRCKLIKVYPYIVTCNMAKVLGLQYDLFNWPDYWMKYEHQYSLCDLVQIKKKQMLGAIEKITNNCIRHVKECFLCMARGFYCEICKSDQILFPFQFDIISSCSNCKAIYHKNCAVNEIECKKCLRIKNRKERSKEEKVDYNSENEDQIDISITKV